MSAKGFTLIETLVVVSIIGILIALSTVGLRGAQSSARDAQRKTDLQDIRSAVETYRADCGVYPPEPLPWGAALVGNGSSRCPASNVYMARVPQDPRNSSHGLEYEYVPNGTFSTYTICAKLENSSAAGTVCGGAAGRNCHSSTASCNYSIVNP